MSLFLPGTTNFIERVIWSDCSVPFHIYIRTFFPAALRYFLVTRLWFWDDFVRAYADAKVGATGTGRGFRHGKFRSYEVFEGETKGERWSRKGLDHVLRITEPLERYGYVLLIVGAADQFFYDWLAAIDRIGPCDDPIGAGPFQRGGYNLAFFPLPGGGEALLPELQQNRSNWSNNAASVTVPTGIWYVSVAATVIGPSVGGGTYQWTLLINQGPFSYTRSGGSTFCPPDHPTDVVASFTIFGSLAIETQITWKFDGPAVPVGITVASANVIVMSAD